MSNLIRLVYTSRARFEPRSPAHGIEPSVARILMQSRRNNPRHKIGGVLYYGNGYFFQCLEGNSDAVNELAARIRQDDRHDEFRILEVAPVSRRLFNNWSMKFIPLEDDIKQLLRKHGHDRFAPQILDAELIERMVELFASTASPESEPDQDYDDKGDKGENEKPSPWARFKRKWLGRKD